MDDRNQCLRHAYSNYRARHCFSWCNRPGCPDNARLNEAGVLLDYLNTDPHFSPGCVVDLFMLKLVACILGHVFRLREIVAEDDYDYGLGEISCERFLGLDWQANFVRKFCTPVVPAPANGEDLITFDVGEVPHPQVQHYRQAFQSNVHLVDDAADLDLSQVLPRDSVFTMRDLSHTL